jgi:arylsulfatase A-like enzyme
VVVAVADHGEAFGEHGYYGHTINIEQEVLHVPLVIALPEGDPTAPRAIDATVETRALFGTLLGLLDVAWAGGRAPSGSPWPLDRHRDESLLGPPEDGDQPAFSGVFLQGTEPRHAKRFKQAALVQGRHKLVSDMTRGIWRLYDLEADPGEQAPLDPAQNGELMRRLRASLGAWIDAMEGRAAPVRGVDPRPEQAAELDKLGYGGAGGGEPDQERGVQAEKVP